MIAPQRVTNLLSSHFLPSQYWSKRGVVIKGLINYEHPDSSPPSRSPFPFLFLFNAWVISYAVKYSIRLKITTGTDNEG